MALILLLETATTSCSVALADNRKIIASKELNQQNVHASHITLFIEEVMANAGKTLKELDAVAVSMGPGSYTGLRIGVSTAKGLCYALDIPLIAINTLKSMAGGMITSGRFSDRKVLYCPMIDARRMEVYTAIFDSDLSEVMPVQAMILDENSFDQFLSGGQLVFFGDGAFKCRELFTESGGIIVDDFVNSARHMNELAATKFDRNEFEDTAYFEPFYLKDFLILKPKSL